MNPDPFYRLKVWRKGMYAGLFQLRNKHGAVILDMQASQARKLAESILAGLDWQEESDDSREFSFG